MLKATVSAVLIVFLSAGVSFAEPPLITEEAETLDIAEMQAELTGEFSFDKEFAAGVKVEERESEVEARIIYGIVDNLELELEVPYAWIKETEDGVETFNENGIADLGLELKWRFYDEDDLSFAVKPMFAFPTGDEEKELGTGRISYGLMLIGSKEIDPIQTEFHLNVGIMHYNYKLLQERDENRSDIWHVSVAATKKIAKGLTACADIGMEENPDKTSHTNPAYGLVGVIYSVSKKLDVDLGVKFGLTEAEPDLAILPGLVWKF